MYNARFFREEHDGDGGVAFIDEVGVLSLILLLVGGDGPLAEVVDFFVHVEGDLTAVLAALGLEDANGFALALNGAALGVYGLDVLVEEDDGGGVFGVGGCGGFGGVEAPLWGILLAAKPVGGAGRAEGKKQGGGEETSRTGRGRKTHH